MSSVKTIFSKLNSGKHSKSYIDFYVNPESLKNIDLNFDIDKSKCLLTSDTKEIIFLENEYKYLMIEEYLFLIGNVKVTRKRLFNFYNDLLSFFDNPLLGTGTQLIVKVILHRIVIHMFNASEKEFNKWYGKFHFQKSLDKIYNKYDDLRVLEVKTIHLSKGLDFKTESFSVSRGRVIKKYMPEYKYESIRQKSINNNNFEISNAMEIDFETPEIEEDDHDDSDINSTSNIEEDLDQLDIDDYDDGDFAGDYGEYDEDYDE